MPNIQKNDLVQYIRGLVGARASERLTDSELLRRFVEDQDEQAFAALVHRHGPMVLRVGRRLLKHEQDAEDVFQAVFLVLARKAHSTRWQSSIGNWLYGVAHRLALEARTITARRRDRETGVDPKQVADPLDELSVREAHVILTEEIARLPEKFRSPLVLCCLEGLAREEAAHQLGWPASLVKSRLEQGRQRLASRLTRRGLTLSTTLAATLLVEGSVAGTVAPTLANSTIRAAGAFSAGTTTGTLSAPSVALAKGALEGVPAMKLKGLWVLLLMVCMTGTGAIAWQAQTEHAERPQVEKGVPTAAHATSKPAVPDSQGKTDRYGDRLPPGAIRRLGTVRFRHGSPISEVRFSADGKTLISMSRQQSVSFWEPSRGKELRRVLVERGQRLLALSPDGKLLASCMESGGPICLRDMATGKILRQLVGDPESIFAAAFSPDGHILVAGGKDRTLRFWKVETGEEMRRTAPQPEQIMALGFSPDGKTLASAQMDGTIALWEAATGQKLRSPEKEGQFVNAVAFSPDGKLLAWGSSTFENRRMENGRIALWDVTKHKEVQRLTGQLKQIGGLAFSRDGNYLVSGGGREDGSIRLWDIATGRKIWQAAAHCHWTHAFAFSPDGKTLASGSTDGTVGVWDVATGKDLRPSTQGHLAAVNGLALSPDGRILASGSWDRTIRLWDPASGEERARLSGHRDTVFRLAFSPDGRLLASAGFDESVRIWDSATRKELHSLQGHSGEVFSVAFSPDGRTLASGAGDGMIRLWNPATGKEVFQIKGPPTGVHGMAFSPDGHLLAGTSYDPSGSVYVWEIPSGKKLLLLRGHEHSWVHCVAFAPDGRTLASGSEDRTIRLWDVKTGEARGRLTGHEALVSSVIFTPDGRTLISSSYDQTIRLWEVATGKERHQFRVDRGWPRTIVLAPDRRTLYSSGDDSALLVWNILDPASHGLHATGKLTAKQGRALWDDLQSVDARQAFRAESVLIASPEQAIALLRENLRPAISPDAKRLDHLLTDLDSEQFAVRANAEAELEALDDLAEPALRKVLKGRPSLEVRRRVDGLLKRLEGTVLDPKKMQRLRALEVLEQIGTSEAAEVLNKMIRGPQGTRITREAKASLQRLTQRNPTKP